jgi:hypothetical protein
VANGKQKILISSSIILRIKMIKKIKRKIKAMWDWYLKWLFDWKK